MVGVGFCAGFRVGALPPRPRGIADELNFVNHRAMRIRLATHLDADEGSQVLRRSIIELCHADHHDDSVQIADWISNKTPETWRTWVNQNATKLYVATEGDRILGVGMMDDVGNILLNYVSPDARWRGVSKAILAHMEAEASNHGLMHCVLVSTKTARAFYLDAGYRADEGIENAGDRMSKRLVR